MTTTETTTARPPGTPHVGPPTVPAARDGGPTTPATDPTTASYLASVAASRAAGSRVTLLADPAVARLARRRAGQHAPEPDTGTHTHSRVCPTCICGGTA